METKILIIIVEIVVGVVCFLLGWLTKSMMKQSKKDWETYYYLHEKSLNLKTKEEIKEFHKEFLEKAKEIHNSIIIPKLHHIDGYVRGLYKHFQNEK